MEIDYILNKHLRYILLQSLFFSLFLLYKAFPVDNLRLQLSAAFQYDNLPSIINVQ